MYSAVPDFAARQRRIYRAQSAAFLANLDLTGREDELASINWSTLESVPHWCFHSSTQQQELRLLCGAVFLAPQMHRWIEGWRIQSVRELIGPAAYDLVLRSTGSLADSESIVEMEGDIATVLEQAGTAVLSGAISHPAIRLLVAGRTDGDEPEAPLPATIAVPLYQRALEIFAQLQQATQSPDLASGSEAGE